MAPAFGAALLLPRAAAAQEDPAARLARGKAAFDAGDYARALKEYEATVAAAPANAEAHEGVLRTLLAQRDTKRAAAAAKVARLSCPGSASTLRLAAVAHVARGEFGTAVEIADEALAAPGGAVPAGFRVKADAVAGAEANIAAGERVLREALKTPVDRPDLLLELGDFLADAGNGDGAVAVLREAVALEKGNVPVLVRLSEVLLVQGKVKEARESALQAVDAGQRDAAAHTALARTFEAEKDYKTALPSFEMAATLLPKSAACQTDLGYALHRAGRLKESESALRLATKLDPNLIEPRLHLGWLLNATTRAKEALEEYMAVLKRVPDHQRALWYAADISFVLGKSRDAEGLLQRLLAAEPDHSEAHRLLADIAYAAGKLDAAKDSIKRALDANAKNPRALLTRGRIEEDEQKFEEAEKTYAEGLEAAPDDEWLHIFMAELCDEVLDKPAEALAHFKKYLELGGPDKDEVVARKIKELETP